MKRIISITFIVLLVVFGCKKEDLTIKEISISTKEQTIKIGEKIKLEVTHTPNHLPAPIYVWRTADSNIAKAYADGTIEALNVGETVISVSTKDNLLKSECIIKVLPIDASEIKFNTNELELFIEEENTLTYTIFPDNTTYKNVTWSSENEDIATVDKNGKVKAIGIGETKIIVKTENSISASCNVKVNPIVSTAIKLNKNTLTLEMSDKETLNAIFTPYNTTNKKIIWSSSDNSIATVSESGEVTGINEGECVILAITEDSGVKAECTVNIKLKGLILSKFTHKMLINDSDIISVFYSTNNKPYNNAIWTSSNPNIATITSNGTSSNTATIVSKSVGTTTIKAISADGVKQTACQLNVTDDIREFINLEIITSGNTIINGFVIGDAYSKISNNSKQTILLTAFYIIDGYSGNIVAMSTDSSKLGTLLPGATTNLGTKLNSVYYPIFRWIFTWNNKSYQIEHQYEKKSYFTPKSVKKLNKI
ncbi:MAG: hypothetical protein GX361_06335 [Bacteroidales bacterium]|nr:hypothetical protein [Bacteroidales bacterium]